MTLFAFEAFSGLHYVLIWVHVGTALAALGFGPVAMLVRKGGHNHRRWGRLYVRLMVVTNAAALWLLLWRWDTFLFGLTVLALYSAVTGQRGIRSVSNPGLESSLMSAAALTSLSLLLLAGYTLTVGSEAPSARLTAALALGFGGLLAQAVVEDVRRNPARADWAYHLNRMVGSYIALVTAFLVQVTDGLVLENVRLLLIAAPSLIAFPIVKLWERYYGRSQQRQT